MAAFIIRARTTQAVMVGITPEVGVQAIVVDITQTTELETIMAVIAVK